MQYMYTHMKHIIATINIPVAVGDYFNVLYDHITVTFTKLSSLDEFVSRKLLNECAQEFNLHNDNIDIQKNRFNMDLVSAVTKMVLNQNPNGQQVQQTHDTATGPSIVANTNINLPTDNESVLAEVVETPIGDQIQIHTHPIDKG